MSFITNNNEKKNEKQQIKKRLVRKPRMKELIAISAKMDRVVKKYFQKIHAQFLRYVTNGLKGKTTLKKENLIKDCILTGRKRSVYRLTRLSRLKSREYGSTGYFFGLKKASW